MQGAGACVSDQRRGDSSPSRGRPAPRVTRVLLGVGARGAAAGGRGGGAGRHTTQTQLTAGRPTRVGWRAGEYIQGPSVDVRMKRVERKVS